MSTFKTTHLPKLFSKLDRDDDDLVSVDELLRFLGAFSVRADRDKLELLIGGNSLNYVDFLFFHETLIKGDVVERGMRRNIETEDEDLRKAFGVFDSDRDGFISCEDLRVALSRLGIWDEVCGQDCRSMISVYDTNPDGLLDFEEFKNMMILCKKLCSV